MLPVFWVFSVCYAEVSRCQWPVGSHRWWPGKFLTPPGEGYVKWGLPSRGRHGASGRSPGRDHDAATGRGCWRRWSVRAGTVPVARTANERRRQGSALVAGGDELEWPLGDGVVERGEA